MTRSSLAQLRVFDGWQRPAFAAAEPCHGPALLRLAIFGEGLISATPSGPESLALSICETLAAAGSFVEVSVCLYSGVPAAKLLDLASEEEILDARGRTGPGLLAFLRPRRGAWGQADLALVVAGGSDLGLRGEPAKDVAGSLRSMLKLARRSRGVARTVASAVPDCGGEAERSLFGATLRARLQATNDILASWVREGTPPARSGSAEDMPDLFLNPGSMLPYGPRAVRAGFWEKDGVHLSIVGARLLGERLARALLHLVEEACCQPSHPQGDEGGSGSGPDGELPVPSLDAFLEAFRLEDEADCEAVTSVFVPERAPRSPLEEESVVVLQRRLRQLLCFGRSRRLALAR
ncbi:unnamed protein product, partial [Polarella glacialis]